ncbi:MAG: xyloglucanase [Opitutaceae bacterium]|nr:xyloglucanase [Opitutaceae bacterium]
MSFAPLRTLSLLGFGATLFTATSLAAVPVRSESYAWRSVAIGGGGFVTGIEFHPTAPGVAYARTDVGGAYRWDGSSRTWQPLLDWLGRDDWNLQGIESLALDPSDPQRVYLAAGTYTHPNVGDGAILRSADGGRTWERAAIPVKFGGNEAGRGSGERLAVDPQSGNILYLGTRHAGLWRSADHGATWERVASFPDVPDDSVLHRAPQTAEKGRQRYNYLAQPVGIVWVKFVPQPGHAGEPTSTIYAAVSRAAGGLYRSIDAGRTWAPVPGQPQGFRPTGASLGRDGSLFVTYADQPGPNRMTDGAVWKLDTATDRWTEVTPEKPAPAGTDGRHFGYAAVCVDRSDPATVVVTTWNREKPFDEIYRSTDGGRTWRTLLERATWDHSSAPYTDTMTHHWMSDIEIDPHARDRMMFTTGYGIWATDNATAADRDEPTRWSFESRNLEETVPLSLVSPPEGAHLVSGLGDVDGFVHDDFDQSPAARFPGPRFKNTETLDFAAAQPALMVRSGTTYQWDKIHGAWSEDGGRHWQSFTSTPPSPDATKRFSSGPIALSADGSVILWTLHGGLPQRSTDRGGSWSPVTGAPVDLSPVADRVEPGTFYGYDALAGILYVSTDGGQTFEAARRDLPKAERQWWGGVPQPEVRAVPGHAGELWVVAGEKLYRFTERGRTVSVVPALAKVGSVGFGKPAPGSDYPAIFAAAVLDGQDGLFRSDDAGKTWVSISDAQHRYGSARLLTGDPRVFGRVYFAPHGRGIVYGEPAK